MAEEEEDDDDFDLPDYPGSTDKNKLRPKPRPERVAKRRIRIKPARKKSNETTVARGSA